ncbi:MAG TPA: PstS family phosphate ABC transporter substrate-binding protein [Phycisphaerae bacterium]|nr:PstS family phosphate ABC transporter substrate-binding protein [Phycisphaerae bacterium]HRY69086.1 PstS family phosphate ABC transporter substrate-binding protein [Phycisphaerae bacterium]HSA25939.1 PstS family phosphate ABC transporter substrate-binding protein [Phycisphaerae bacterium]
MIRASCLACGLFLLPAIGCNEQQTGKEPTTVRVDGSSTVAPISMVAAEMFQGNRPDVRVSVGISGTGGGFKKFLDTKPTLRTDINDASRPIKPAEMETARKVGVQYVELPIALDGIAVMVNPSNTFCDHLTLAELKKIWEPGSKINNWKDVRAGFPDLPLKLYGPGTDSGTFDYFTEAVVGKEKACRSDYSGNENDNVLVQGVSGDPGSLGYFGFAYYEANTTKLKLLAIDNGDGKPVKPSLENIRAGTYRPLSRPLFLYVNRESLAKSEVKSFIEYYLANVKSIVEHPKVKYVSLPDAINLAAIERLRRQTTGSVLENAKPGESANMATLYGAK